MFGCLDGADDALREAITVAYSLAGTLLATADGDDTAGPRPPGIARFQPLPDGTGTAVTGAASSPDGKLLAVASANGIVQLWSPATRQAVGDPHVADLDTPFTPGGAGSTCDQVRAH